MDRAHTLALPLTAGKADYLEDTSLRRLIVEYYDAEHLSLRRYLSFLGVDPETSREIVQESFLKLNQHLLAGGDRANLRAWLYRVAHNLARNAQKSFRATKTDLLDDSLSAASESSVEEELLNRERMTRLRQAIAQLGPAQRQCLVLRAQGFKYREIAEVLNLAISTVAENVQRGLEKLKESI